MHTITVGIITLAGEKLPQIKKIEARKPVERGSQWRSGNAPTSNARGPGFESQAGTDDCTKFSDCPTLSDESINRGPVWVRMHKIKLGLKRSRRWCLCQVSAGYNNIPSTHRNNIRKKNLSVVWLTRRRCDQPRYATMGRQSRAGAVPGERARYLGEGGAPGPGAPSDPSTIGCRSAGGEGALLWPRHTSE